MRAWVLAAVLLALAPGVASAQDDGPGAPACRGAASMDPDVRCVNPGLSLQVAPMPQEALLDPAFSVCHPASQPLERPVVCRFGAEPAQATGQTVALLGDSHALTWRAALDEVARPLGWTGLSLAKPGCQFSTLVLRHARSGCARLLKSVLEWLAAHPEVETVFVAASALSRLPVPKGEDAFEAKVAGAAEAIARLPPSVQHVVVLRDTPVARLGTGDCVELMVARGRAPGLACATRRSRGLPRDALAAAAIRIRSPRVQVVDLTALVCGALLCRPVIGGVLVHKDRDHMTEPFTRTLGPYLSRSLQRLMVSWD